MPKPTVHRKRRTRPPKRPHLKLTPEEKAHYLHEIKKQFLAGGEIKDIATNLNISEASIYRWQRQADEIQKTLNASSSVSLIDIGSAINRLYFVKDTQIALTMEALFQFLCWIRWPSEPGYYAAAMINCLTSYQKQRFSVQHIDGMDEYWRRILLKYLTIDVVQRFSSPYAGLIPILRSLLTLNRVTVTVISSHRSWRTLYLSIHSNRRPRISQRWMHCIPSLRMARSDGLGHECFNIQGILAKSSCDVSISIC